MMKIRCKSKYLFISGFVLYVIVNVLNYFYNLNANLYDFLIGCVIGLEIMGFFFRYKCKKNRKLKKY